tara:strand:- start:721 stop:1458 length:738 start_codon:yes stop_codon:yes gene_type:complete
MNTVTIGSWISLNHFSIAEILADCGFDWLCIDLEHSATDFFETKSLISAIQSKGIQAFVRVGENNDLIIKRVLDAGADGIIVPLVNSREEAQRAIDSVNYPPKGKRGVGLSRAQGYGFDFENYKDNIAPSVKLIVQIEHFRAIENFQSIIELDGVDGAFIGPYDLSGSLGKPGRYNDTDVLELLEKYETICKKSGKLMGYHVIQPDHKLLLEKIEQGYNFLAFSIDSLFLGSLARQEMSNLKKLL